MIFPNCKYDNNNTNNVCEKCGTNLDNDKYNKLVIRFRNKGTKAYILKGIRYILLSIFVIFLISNYINYFNKYINFILIMFSSIISIALFTFGIYTIVMGVKIKSKYTEDFYDGVYIEEIVKKYVKIYTIYNKILAITSLIIFFSILVLYVFIENTSKYNMILAIVVIMGGLFFAYLVYKKLNYNVVKNNKK